MMKKIISEAVDIELTTQVPSRPLSRRIGITPSENQNASSICGYPDRMNSSTPLE
jgi:hypothetical protein